MGRACNHTGFEEEISYMFPEAVVATLLVLTNAFTLIVLNRIKKRQIQHYFMIILAVAEMAISIELVASELTLHERIDLLECYPTLCSFLSVYGVTTILGILNVHTGLAVNSFIMVAYPVFYHNTQKNLKRTRCWIFTGIAITVLVEFTSLSALAYTGNFDVYYSRLLGFCSTTMGPLSQIVIFPFLLTSLLTQICCSALTIYKLLKLQKQRRKRACKGFASYLMTLLVFYVMLVPFIIRSATKHSLSAEAQNDLSRASFLIFVCHSNLTFFIYLITLKDFRNTFILPFQCSRKKAFIKRRVHCESTDPVQTDSTV